MCVNTSLSRRIRVLFMHDGQTEQVIPTLQLNPQARAHVRVRSHQRYHFRLHLRLCASEYHQRRVHYWHCPAQRTPRLLQPGRAIALLLWQKWPLVHRRQHSGRLAWLWRRKIRCRSEQRNSLDHVEWAAVGTRGARRHRYTAIAHAISNARND